MNALTVIPQPAVPAMTIGDVARVAEAIAKGGLFGSKDPNAVFTLCLLAQAEGQHPAVVFRDYHIISGKPAKKADAMLRDFINSGGKVEWHRLDDECADATFTHPAGSARIEWTLARAKKAQISNQMWNKYPRQMLRSRVISEGVRTVYPGATSGLYEENEVHDIVAETRPIDGGDIQGQSQGGEVGPDAPVEYGAEAPVAPRKGWREPDSPYSTPSKLHAATAAMERELAGCGDSEMVYGVTATDEWKELVRVAEKHAPHYLRGGDPAPPEFEGLLNTAERLVREFDTAIANNMTDLARV